MDDIIKDYITLIEKKKSNGGGESSYYTPFEVFLKDACKKLLKKDINVLIEYPHPFGIPDFTVFDKKNKIIGIIEAKRPRTNLIKMQKTDQIQRYRKGETNFIFTNFYGFRLYDNSKIVDNALISNYKSNKNIERLLKTFLSPRKSKIGDNMYTIQGRDLTKRQIKLLKRSKKVKLTREGGTIGIYKSDMSIRLHRSEYSEEDYIIAGYRLNKREINHFESYGWVVINHNGLQYMIQWE